MGLFDKFKKNKKHEESTSENSYADLLLGFILLKTPELDWDHFKSVMEKDWNIVLSEGESEDGKDSDTKIYTINGMMVAVSLMPYPVPEDEAVLNAENNYLWPEAVDKVKEHTAQILLSVLQIEDISLGAAVFVKTAAALQTSQNAIGIYFSPNVFEANMYIETAKDYFKDGDLPWPLLIYVGLYNEDQGNCAFTVGLTTFGKEELEIIDSETPLTDLIECLLDISTYVISNDVTLQDGETIGLTAEQKLPITRSKGVAVEGYSLKIGL